MSLTNTERVSYGVGDLGINLFFMSSLTYLLYFYTDVLGISAVAAAGVLFTARLVDALTDPIMGLIAERTHTRWGRLRPYIFLGVIPLGVLAVMTFTVPTWLDESGRLWWAYLTYIAFGIAYTVVVIPYSMLTATLTQDHDERTLLSTLRMAFAFAGGFGVSVFMLSLVNSFATQAEGFRWVMVGFSVVAILLLWVTVWFTKERVTPPPKQRLSIAMSLRAVFINPPLLLVMLLFTCGMLAFTVRQTVAIYYFKYNLGRPDLIEPFFAATLGVMMIGLLAVPALAATFGKARCIMLGALLTLLGCAGLYLTSYDAPMQAIAWGCVIALGGTPIAVLGWAMIPDTVEYAQWKHGVRADGAVYAFSSFFQKLAKTAGGAGVALGLAFAGYLPNQEQSAESLGAIRLMITLGPASIMLVTLVVASLYRLDKTAHEQMLDELAARDGSESPV